MRSKLIVVDDDPAMRMLLRETLVFHGFVVEDFADGRSAIDGADWDGAKTAIVDWMMPGMSGVDVVVWLADNHPDVDLLMLTAAKDALLQNHPEVLDIARVLSKEELTVDTVREHL